MKIINQNVYSYFGVNDDVLQNKAVGDSWSAFYEGAVEPFAVQLSEVLTNMLIMCGELNENGSVMATANRLQYMNTQSKVNMAQQMLDRGVLSINEARLLFNLEPVEGGDIRTIRGEYKNAEDEELTQTGGTEDANENK
jgi:hypothetical protein